jgi:hypothetical protein
MLIVPDIHASFDDLIPIVVIREVGEELGE